MPRYRRPSRWAASPVVPAPEKGSSTVPLGGHPAAMHRNGMSTGNGAQWASWSGRVENDQTSPGFLPDAPGRHGDLTVCGFFPPWWAFRRAGRSF